MFRLRNLMKRFLTPAIARGRGFARDERGVTAIEFGILAVPFLTIILATLETAIMFLGMQVLDSALEDATRMVRTGRAQSAGYDATTLRNYMCDYTFRLFNCNSIQLRVEVLPDFGSVVINPVVQTCTPAVNPTTCTFNTPPAYNAGTARQVVQVSAYYRWPLMFAIPWFSLKNQPDNYFLMSAIRVFRNEPFS